MADANAAAKEQAQKGAEAKQKSVEEFVKLTSGRPTPTQAENDQAKLGVTFDTHEDDGSGPEPKFVVTRVVEQSKPSGGGSSPRPAASRA